ncbi:MAG: ankyrin repeat domain-containing protein [Acidobacteria bacterium]|nr:ankyrin repeat domain-containing protein [Acidobacteriota bacterium]
MHKIVLSLLLMAVRLPAQTIGDGMTPLHWAAENEDLTSAQDLLRQGAAVDAITRVGGLTPLHLAARNGNAALLATLLKAGAGVQKPNATGTTALMFAAASGNVAAVQALLAAGAEVNARESANNQTALMFAAALNRVDVVRLLLSKGADFRLKTKVAQLERLRVDMDGNIVPAREGGAPAGAPAAPASSKAEGVPPKAPVPETPKVAAKVEAKAATPAAKPEPPKPGAAKAGDVANFGPRESGTTVIGGMTALLYAARDGHRDTVTALLDAGANVNEVNESEKTSPLVLAIINGHFDVAQLLLDRGADPNLANTSGLAALYAVIDVQWAPRAWYPQPDTTQQKTGYLQLIKNLLAKAPIRMRSSKSGSGSAAWRRTRSGWIPRAPLLSGGRPRRPMWRR